MVAPPAHRSAARAISRAVAVLALAAPMLRGQSVPASPGPMGDEVPCTALRSALHGVVLLGARLRTTGGPPCTLMEEYRDWLARSDTVVGASRDRSVRFTGREWDFAAAALRLGAPTWFVLIRGDSLPPSAPGLARRLFLTAFAAEPGRAPARLGSWYVLVDEDSTARQLFRSPLTGRRLHAVLADAGSRVYAVGGVRLDAARVRRQLAEAAALRRALGFDSPLPRARFIVGPAGDSTLAMLGVVGMPRALYAMTVHPPLAVFQPLGADGGLDAHELVHVATFGRRDAIPPAVGEAFAMHHGGAHGRPFAEAFCANGTMRALDTLTTAQLDSALAGAWWRDPRADVTGFALGHAMGWFLARHGDSTWVFADGAPPDDPDALRFLAARSGLSRDAAVAGIVATFNARLRDCRATAASASRIRRPSGAADAPAPGSR